MKNNYIFLIILLLVPLIMGSEKESRQNAPAGLMVEFIRDPGCVAVNDLKPEFSWIVPSEARFQTAWQIILRQVKGNSGAGTLIWDSGKVNGSQSVSIEFPGGQLLPATLYSWKVRTWDHRGKAGAFSEEQIFMTGTPDKEYQTTSNRFMETKIKPEKILITGHDKWFIDFGKAAFGTLVLKINPAADDTIIVHLGEKLSSAATIDRKPGGTIRYQRLILPVREDITEYTIKLPPDARNTGPAAVRLPDTIGVITPFRYCELENCKFPVSTENIYQKAFSYYFDDSQSSFSSSDSILNQVWDLCKYSMKATSFAGIYVDGDRERIAYEADAYINQLGHYYTDREYSLARLSNEYFMSNPTWPTEWILHTVLMFYNDYLFTGDIESLSFWYEKLKHKTLISLAGENSLISSKRAGDELMIDLGFKNPKERIRDIVDWPPAQKDTGWKLATPEGERDGYELVEINTVVNSFYYRNLELMSVIAGYLGKKNDSLSWAKEALKVKTSINSLLLDSQKGIYTDGLGSEHSSLHANMLPLAFGLVPEDKLQSVVSFIKSRGMACSVYGAQYLLEGLYQAGAADYAYQLMTATHDRSWWNMIASGSTISLEAWDMKYKPNSDWSHAWGAAPANIIPAYLWGIRPLSPGFSKVLIAPQPGPLKNSEITVPTIRGLISASFTSNEGSYEYIVSIPGNMEAEFRIPQVGAKNLALNGRKITDEISTLKLSPGLNKINF
jgi:hypothetical protein